MLEKNKDYLEMRVSSTDCALTQNEATQISIDGCAYTTYMDIPNPGELYVFISKEKFEKLQVMADGKAWKKLTGCPTPIAAKTLIESGMSYEHGYHEVQEENRKLTEEVESWQNVTGHATPEDYLAAKIHTVYVKLEPSNVTWRDATGCDTPEEAKTVIESMKAALRESNRVMVKELENNIDEWQKATGRISPEAAKQYIGRLKGRLNKIHGYSVDW